MAASHPMAAPRSSLAWRTVALAWLVQLPPLTGCVAVGTPRPVAATSAELEASMEAPPPFCPRAGGLPLGAPSPLSIDELRALLGRPVAEPRTREALARLGPASVEPDGSGAPLREHLHARFGVVVVVDGEARDRGGATKIAVRFTRALGALPAPDAEVRIGVDLLDASGEAVRALDGHGAVLGPLRAERVVVPHVSAPWHAS